MTNRRRKPTAAQKLQAQLDQIADALVQIAADRIKESR